jgi:oligosaccharyltransferase complex subunit alpha (ribophorin I)
MRSLRNWGALLLPLFSLPFVTSCLSAESRLVLPKDFSPPQVFKNINLLRTLDITKPYVRETIVVIIENISKEPQAEYYVPVAKETVQHFSYFKAKDKKGNGEEFVVSPVEFDPNRFVRPAM